MRKMRWVSAALAAVMALSIGAQGQALVMVNGVWQQEEAVTGGFALPKEDSKAIGRLEDFDRYVGKKAWDLAFRAMSGFSDTEGQGMVPAADGFMVPLRRRIAQSLKDLPAEGRDAYRLFYDAEARQLWEKLQTASRYVPTSGVGGQPTPAVEWMHGGPERMSASEEMQALQKIVTRYFLTSVGDLAADRLGDIYFEQGDFGNAAAAWQQVLRDYPDAHLPAVKLEAKRCLALWRQGRREELAGAVAHIRERYAGQMVTFGGKEMEVGAFVEGLKLEPVVAAGTQPATMPALTELKFSSDQKPLWQVRAVLPESLERMDQQLRNMGWSFRNYQFKGLVPTAVADDKRVYVNWLGMIYAVDLETGKMLWRTSKFTDVSQNPVNFVQYGIDLQRFGLSVIGGKVFAIVSDPSGRNNGDGPYQVQCLNAETGKQLWKGDGLLAVPVVLNGVAYSLGSQRDESMYLMAINMETGKIEWKVALGKPQMATNYRGYRDFGTPALVGVEGMVYVGTNNGALVAVNTAQRRVEWALKHETKMFMPNRGWDEEMSSSEEAGTLVMNEGTIYAKDGGGSVLYAVDPSGPSLKWKRPMDSDARIVDIERGSAYVLGKDGFGEYYAALDLKNRDALAWSERLGAERTSFLPLVLKDHVYFLTTRGIAEIDPTLPVGEVHLRSRTRWGDHEISGGRLFLAGSKVISVTDIAVSAYEMGKGGKPAATTETSKVERNDGAPHLGNVEGLTPVGSHFEQ